MDKKLIPPLTAEAAVINRIKWVEENRKARGMSMRALSSAAGLRPSTYWGILRSEKNMAAVRAATLLALEEAVDAE